MGNGIQLQDASLDIWASKYQLKDHSDNAVEETPLDSLKRVAKALAEVEPKNKAKHEKDFLWALESGATPGGRILSNAGAGQYKPATSLINCTVSQSIPDSMDGILGTLHLAGLTLKAGCGIGYEFSTLRPNKAFVAGAGAYTSGPLSFMDIYDKMCFTVSSAGGRRGAQMATFDISHPDILDFIKAKRENGRLRQFNLSALITADFMEAVKNDENWDLVFPVTRKEVCGVNGDIHFSSDLIYKKIGYANNDGNLIKNENGEYLCRIHKTLPARRLWDVIMTSTYDFAEPGFILIDAVNEMNNNWFCENIRATNPCGEQPLPPNGACLLGSVNLTKFVKNPFTNQAEFDWLKFQKVVTIFTRMLDNVVEISGLPLPEQREELIRKRRHGMGYFGLGSALSMMKMKYGSSEAVAFTGEVTRVLAITGMVTGLDLAKEKGAAPIMNEVFEVTSEMLAKRPEMVADGYKVGQMVEGKVLWAKYSRYMRRITENNPELLDQFLEHGCRFTHHSSIAPTGTMALSFGNNASNGIEPSFSHSYSRNVIREGKKSKEKVGIFSSEFILYREIIDAKADPFNLPEYLSTSESITPKEHVDMQSAAQYWVDSAISKTINVPTEIKFDEFKDIYQYAYDKGLKGCTTFRFNPEAFQGVLVTEKDLANTTYKFTLEDGSTVEFKGNEGIEYDGEIHTAANLYDAIKEGYYGKF